jgi:hypothetical protein
VVRSFSLALVLIMSADVGFDVRVHLLNVQLNAGVENKALGWALEPHLFKSIGLYYKGRFVWAFDADGKTGKELLKEIIDHACVCMNFQSAVMD